jgi:alkylhydroperoxidase family enzyme
MHVTDPPVEQLHWMLRPLFWLQRRRHGQYLTPAKVWARVPALYAALTGFYAAVERRGSPFCIDLNASISAQRSGSLDKALAVDHWRESDAFDLRERLALEYAEAITRTEGQVSDVLIAGLRQFFDEAALIELTALVAFQNLSSKFNAALDIPAQGLCRMPPG